MLVLLLGLVVFLGTHLFTTARAPRAALIGRFGEGGYKVVYSVLSLIGIVLAAKGFGQYRAAGMIEVWTPPVWTRHLALVLVLVAFIAFVAAYLPGRIKRALKHPMLVGVKVWALSHLLANGDLGSMLLFGSFLAWAVIARISIKRRDEVVVHGGPATATASPRNDILAVAIGTVAWFVFAKWLHPLLIGVVVMPGA